jgi:TRAP-type mannitol/chloroaromatic compound transport system substrate-binding protein
MSWKAIERYSKDYQEMSEKQGVKFYKTPDRILKRQLEAWDKVAGAKDAENPAFKKVNDSMRAFARRAGRWQNDTLVDYKIAYNHFFAKKRG